MNARYVIATKAKVDLKGIDGKAVDKVSTEGYFTKEKAQQKKGEEQFFSQGEKPEVGPEDRSFTGMRIPWQRRDMLTDLKITEEASHIGTIRRPESY